MTPVRRENGHGTRPTYRLTPTAFFTTLAVVVSLLATTVGLTTYINQRTFTRAELREEINRAVIEAPFPWLEDKPEVLARLSLNEANSLTALREHESLVARVAEQDKKIALLQARIEGP